MARSRLSRRSFMRGSSLEGGNCLLSSPRITASLPPPSQADTASAGAWHGLRCEAPHAQRADGVGTMKSPSIHYRIEKGVGGAWKAPGGPIKENTKLHKPVAVRGSIYARSASPQGCAGRSTPREPCHRRCNRFRRWLECRLLRNGLQRRRCDFQRWRSNFQRRFCRFRCRRRQLRYRVSPVWAATPPA